MPLISPAYIIEDHPIDIARQILTSTGNASNGAYDTLAAAAGYGFADRFVDHLDCDKFRAFTSPSSGSADWSIVVTEAQDNGYAWLQSWLQLGGYFLTMRQGRVTVRGAQLLTVGTTSGAQVNGIYQPANITITDDDLDGPLPSWQAWDSSHTVEYSQHRIKTASGKTTTTETITGLPAALRWLDNLEDLILDNESNNRALLARRLKQWRLRVPERLVIPWVGGRLAQLAAGDPVRLNLTRAAGRLPTSSSGYRDHWALVVQNDVDWLGMRGTVTLAVPPDKEDEFG